MRGEFWKEFSAFIQEYKIISVGVAFVMGQAINEFVKSFVSNIFMPLLNPLIPDGTWKTSVLSIWKFNLAWGAFLASFIQFIIISLIIFIVVKKLLKLKREN